MSAPTTIAILLVLAVAFGGWRTRRAPRLRGLRIGLQVAAAVLLYFCLFPPPTREHFAADQLVVLTPGITPAQLDALPLGAGVVALPGVAAPRAIERAPDLGTALRRHADARRLRIVGGGLPPRDRDAARGLVAAFEAAPLPRGLVEFDAPSAVRAGSVWRLGGRVEGVADGRVELRDPSGAVVATQALDAGGRFELQASAKSEGAALFALNVIDREGARVDAVAVPLAARAGAPLKVLLLAGAPDPELKYLRRWAADAGLALDSRIGLSEGVALTEGAPKLDRDALQTADLAIVDERAWAALDAAAKQALNAAVRDGLGLLLRVTGPVPEPVAADWAGLGYRVRAGEPAVAAKLDRAFAPADTGLAFARASLEVEAKDAASLLRADDGAILAWVGNRGSGRVALWLLADSYRLSLAGAGAAFGTLWSDAFGAVARPRETSEPTLPSAMRVDERAVLCGVADDAAVENEAGVRTDLLVDAADRCAAYWPEAPGWHALLEGGRRWPFFVRPGDAATGLVAGDAARATRALLGAASSAVADSDRERPLPRWPFFLAWLAVTAALWWLERGTVPRNDQSPIAAPRTSR
ncbi:hypothetical protein [Dokdonella sp.]|uniref:hypothetical protein n=1 Tax=Dokdonella sp. TaxID=2291710 RepID=UPI001B2F7FE8|nr:hypothetical protein [Dokdonella sp.]MBO9662025.1 hypothetical protein [Dokdonella sp.]